MSVRLHVLFMQNNKCHVAQHQILFLLRHIRSKENFSLKTIDQRKESIYSI